MSSIILFIVIFMLMEIKDSHNSDQTSTNESGSHCTAQTDSSPDLMKECVKAGVSKITVNPLVLDDYYENFYDNAGQMPHTQLIEDRIEKVVDLAVRWMEICGSDGQAPGISRSSYQTRSLDESREERRSLLQGLMEGLDAPNTSYDVAGLTISVRENLE